MERQGIRPAPTDGPLRALDLVECPARGTLLARACGTRHAARIPSGGGRGAPKFHDCAACPRGALHLERLRASGWEPPADTLPAEILPNAQRCARKRWERTFAAYATPAVERGDPVREAASLTPDDRPVHAHIARIG